MKNAYSNNTLAFPSLKSMIDFLNYLLIGIKIFENRHKSLSLATYISSLERSKFPVECPGYRWG